MQSQTVKLGVTLSHLAGMLLCSLFIAWSLILEDGALIYTLADDAMISMTYARTLAETGEFIWYPGAEKVQGITNILWALVMALIHWVGLAGSMATIAMSIIGAIIVFLTAHISGLVARDMLPSDGDSKVLARVMAQSLVYLSYPIVFWTLRGYEVGLISLLTVSLVRVLQSQSESLLSKVGPTVALLVAIGIFSRLDFFVISLSLFLAAFAYSLTIQDGATMKLALIGIGATFLSISFVLLFQSMTWGDLLPNTYYLKATGEDLTTRIARGFLGTLKSIPVLLMAGYACAQLWRLERNSITRLTTLALAATSLGLSAYSIYVGGDVWEDFLFANRYVTPILPLVAISLAALSQALVSRNSIGQTIFRLLPVLVLSATFTGVTTNNESSVARMIVLPIVVGSAFLLPSLFSVVRKNSKLGRERAMAYVSLPVAFFLLTSSSGLASALYFGKPQGVSTELVMIQNGRDIASATTPEATVLVAWAGIPVYFSQRPAFDLLGKNDRRIASLEPPEPIPGTWNEKFVPGHNKWSFDISVVESRPDLIFQFMDHPGERFQLQNLGYLRACLQNTGYEVWYLGASTEIVTSNLVPCAN